MFWLQIVATKLPKPETQSLFHPTRKWRWDFSWNDRMIAVEIQGGTWIFGRHTRPKGIENDCRKKNEATLLGWKVFEFTTDMVKSGEALETIKKALKMP